jgi:hypothetical protein
MSDSVVTVRDVFELPQPGSPEESSPRWQTLRQWISEEVKGIKASAMPDVAAKIAELLEVPISDILLASWKRTDVIKELLEESRKTPDAVTSLELADHTINSQHHPHIEIRGKNASLKKIEFKLRLLFKLKGFRLRIQGGAIREIQSGPCEVQGTFEYQGLTVAEKKLTAIKLPATVTLEGSKIEDQNLSLPKAAVGVSSTNASEKVTPMEFPKLNAPTRQQPTSPVPDAPKLIPPVKVTTNITEAVREPKIVEVRNEVPKVQEEEEEEREQFVL